MSRWMRKINITNYMWMKERKHTLKFLCCFVSVWIRQLCTLWYTWVCTLVINRISSVTRLPFSRVFIISSGKKIFMYNLLLREKWNAHLFILKITSIGMCIRNKEMCHEVYRILVKKKVVIQREIANVTADDCAFSLTLNNFFY
jgi:hypothetical protein